MPDSAEFRRHAEVARQIAKEERGADHFIWTELALFWENVADYVAAEEAQLPRQRPRATDKHS